PRAVSPSRLSWRSTGSGPTSSASASARARPRSSPSATLTESTEWTRSAHPATDAAFLDWMCPTMFHRTEAARSGCPDARVSTLATASWTRFSPRSRTPSVARRAASSTGWNLVTTTRSTASPARSASASAASTRSRVADSRAASSSVRGLVIVSSWSLLHPDQARLSPRPALATIGEQALVGDRTPRVRVDPGDAEPGELPGQARPQVDPGRAGHGAGATPRQDALDLVDHLDGELVVVTCRGRPEQDTRAVRPGPEGGHGIDEGGHGPVDRARPAGMGGPDHPGLRVGGEHRDAVRREHRQRQPRPVGDHPVGARDGSAGRPGHAGDPGAVDLVHPHDVRGGEPESTREPPAI